MGRKERLSEGPAVPDTTDDSRMLWRIKALHSVVWVVFAGAVLAIPPLALFGQLAACVWLSLLVWIETAVLVANRWRCPLTGVAARYTDDRADNFDIFLPAWLARHNKLIFGALFAVGELLLLWRWLGMTDV